MAWEAGVIANATPAGPKTTAGTLSARINAIMPTGWSFIENIPTGTSAGQTGSANTICDVYKSSSANNDAGVDFYIGIYITTATGALTKVIVAEDYLSISGNPADANRGKFRRQCPVPITGTTPDVTNFTFSETYATCNAISVADFSPTLVTTGFSYWLKMTANFLLICVKVGTTISTGYFGLMDSVISNTTDTMPLVSFGTANAGSMSRLPGVTVGAGGAGMWGAEGFPWSQSGDQAYTLVNVDLWGNSRVPVSRIGVAHDVTLANEAAYGGIRGLLKSDVLLASANLGTAVGPGDTMTIDGNTWTCVSSSAAFKGSSQAAIYNPSNPGFVFVRAN
jgi:hypothetical protein